MEEEEDQEETELERLGRGGVRNGEQWRERR